MEASQQELLKSAWLGGRTGNLSALTQAKVWALREVWRESGKSEYGMHMFISKRVKKIGGGCPTRPAISQLLDKIDADRDWFPGKSTQEQHGPQSAITPTNQAIVARSAMIRKEQGSEITYPSMVAANPVALLNPDTGEPVGKKRVYSIMRERCYDDEDDPEDTWDHSTRLAKWALTDANMRQRWDWALWMQGDGGHSDAWYFSNLVWTDICNTILARTEKRWNEIALAKKRGKGWQSKKSKMKNINLKGRAESYKQIGRGAIRVWWAPILSRGKLHIEILGTDFPGEKPEAMDIFVGRVRSGLNVRFQGQDAPKVLFTDRGQGFYVKNTGKITRQYKAALREHGLKNYYGDSAARQPGNLQDFLLHETAVSWIRYREKKTRVLKPWEETVEAYSSRMKGIVQDINDRLDVEGLCRGLPSRLQELVDAEGGRIPH